MAKAKDGKQFRSYNVAAPLPRKGNKHANAAAGAADSDSDLEDVLPKPILAAGPHAYRSLIGSLDVFTSRDWLQTSSRPQKKTKAAAECASEDWRQHPPSQQAGDDSATTLRNTANRTEAVSQDSADLEAPEAAAASYEADQAADDHFAKHFQQATLKQSNQLHHAAPAEAAQSPPGMHKSACANAEWVNTGQPFPKVSSASFLITTVDSAVLHWHTALLAGCCHYRAMCWASCAEHVTPLTVDLSSTRLH